MLWVVVVLMSPACAVCLPACRVLRPGSAGSARSSDPSSRGSSKPVSRANSQQLEVDVQQVPSHPDIPVGAAGGASSSSSGHHAGTPGSGQVQTPSRLGRQQQQSQVGEPPTLGGLSAADEDPAMLELYTSALHRHHPKRAGDGGGGGGGRSPAAARKGAG